MESNFSSLIAAAEASAVLEASSPTEGIIFEMDGAVAPSRRSAELLRPCRTGGDDDYFPPCFSFGGALLRVESVRSLTS